MKVDAVVTSDLDKAGAEARELEEMGYDGLKSIETAHDPFLPLLLAAQSTTKIDLTTGIAVAFARSPMTLANVGHDLNAASKGRFNLGLGSQIRPHITKRYSMPWSSPAARMREMILAMRAIWACWHEGKPLEFLGKFYTHTLMTPFFTPTNTEYGPPKVYLAAVGPMMAEVAGEVADGLLVHGFTTQAYLETVTMPALERGFAKAGKTRADFEIAYPVFSVMGRDEKEIAAETTKMRQQVAFY
ncbi:MAG: TIGR03617 family F420-dependent LLM class oxidoreductase, partial [Rhodospirillaceae bacterium]|nr:TIGR03617 family F420-dependent LLM class oxidoreductase [Rhodospirillaceae bacterium]